MAMLVILALLIIFAFLVKGRTGHPGLNALRNWNYAHRGLHTDGVPENSLAAFSAAKEAGYGMELDVHLMKDGNLAVIHDSSLKRTAGADVFIEDITSQELDRYFLEDTKEKIPLFNEVLALVDGKVPLIVELKPVGENYASLCQVACDYLEQYDGMYCIESFDPRCIAWLRKNRPNVIRGQLTKNFFHTESDLSWQIRFAMRHQIMNVFTRPDFIAYQFEDRKTLSNFLCRHIWGVQGVTWTIQSKEDLKTACNEGWIVIFEDFNP